MMSWSGVEDFDSLHAADKVPAMLVVKKLAPPPPPPTPHTYTDSHFQYYQFCAITQHADCHMWCRRRYTHHDVGAGLK